MIGPVILIAIICIAVLYLRRRRRHKLAPIPPATEEKGHQDHQDKPQLHSDSLPFTKFQLHELPSPELPVAEMPVPEPVGAELKGSLSNRSTAVKQTRRKPVPDS